MEVGGPNELIALWEQIRFGTLVSLLDIVCIWKIAYNALYTNYL